MRLSYKYHTFNIPLWLLRLLKRHTHYVRAAGGIVTAPDGTMLLILRNGRWDLAKGKVEAGETLLQAALREVEEETGIKPQLSPFTQLSPFQGGVPAGEGGLSPPLHRHLPGQNWQPPSPQSGRDVGESEIEMKLTKIKL